MSGFVYYRVILDFFFYSGRNTLMNFKQVVIRLACLTLAQAQWVRVDRSNPRKRT